MPSIRFKELKPEPHRRHYLMQSDVATLLSRLPGKLLDRLTEVRFDDSSLSLRRLGYVSNNRHTITIRALPHLIDLTGYLEGRSPRLFGALPATAWPEIAIKRFLLYDMFLQLLGHMQVVEPRATGDRRFAAAGEARKFASHWRTRLWAECKGELAIHQPPTSTEVATIQQECETGLVCYAQVGSFSSTNRRAQTS